MARRWDIERLWEQVWNHPIGRAVLLALSALAGSVIYSAVLHSSPGYVSALFLAVVGYLVSMRLAPPRRRRSGSRGHRH